MFKRLLRSFQIHVDRIVADLGRGTARHIAREAADLPKPPARGPLFYALAEALTGRPADFHFAKVAVVTVLPPQTTGIADCSARSFVEAVGPIDIFSPFADDLDWLTNRAYFAGNPNVTVYPADLMPLVARLAAYEHVVFVLGNSDHCVPVLKLADMMRVAGCGRSVFYIHDPLLLNLAFKSLRQSVPALQAFLSRHYRDLDARVPGLGRAETYAATVRVMTAAGLLGAGPVVRQHQADLVLVNSAAARTILEAELSAVGAAVPVREVFHPVFAREARPAPSAMVAGEGPLIGTYGIPGESKLTHRIAAAVAHLVATGRPCRLLVAGYKANAYMAKTGLRGPHVTIVDGPSLMELEQLMGEADVAVQLRMKMHGESSGVVPMLLAQGRSVIVSDIDNFLGFGGAVALFDNAKSDEALADLIWHTAHAGRVDPAVIAAYVADHTPRRFCERLDRLLAEDLAASRGDLARMGAPG